MTPPARTRTDRSPLLDASVLVTGGTGSFGVAFVRRALDDGARRVVVFSRGESRQAAMRIAFNDDPRLRFLIGDVRDATRVMDACRNVEIVVHAAALKRVESCEADPYEAVATNVYGSQHVARACIERGVTRAVFLSTDKASAPCTLYGATKLTAERAWTRANVYAAGTPTRFAATRYGNVLGSTGSVMPLWDSQSATGVLTITDPAMSRFWMPMSAAVDLVLLALRDMRGGETFVPRIASASVVTLARALYPDAQHKVTGAHRGEKTHESLLSADESAACYDYGDHWRIEPERTWESLVAVRGQRVASGFSYRSDTNPQQLTIDSMRALLAGDR